MSAFETNLPNSNRGETFKGFSFLNITINDIPEVITGCQIDIDFKREINGDAQKRISTITGEIEIIDPSSFEIKKNWIVDLQPTKFFYDIRFTYPDNTIKYLIKGTWTINATVTNG